MPVVPEELLVPGRHNRINLLAAALAVHRFTDDAEGIAASIASFPGIPHRLEHVRCIGGIDFYNDSAATIPRATVEAIESFSRPLRLIAGGTDKELEFSGIGRAYASCAGIYLLAGSATELLIDELKGREIAFSGPFPNLKACLQQACSEASAGDIVLFSPGAASFELFSNEFDRGNYYKEMVKKIEKI
jgi:UDP-N-acetylmuramoylalanine--D-glutamate ligase